MRNLHEDSGSRESDDKLIAFLYILMRDHLTPGTVQGILHHHVQEGSLDKYTNGFLFDYCEWVANELRVA